MATYKHLRSSTANKRPTTSIADGQLAINTNTASPGLFFKDSAGTGIVKVGPVHVGTTAPNSSPAGSSGNYVGEQWLDTSLSPAQMKVWNGSAWIGVVADELPVSKLQDGAPRQLVQTDAAGTGVEWTSNIDVPGTLDVTGATTLDSTLTVPLGSAAAPTLRFSGDANSGLYSPGADQVAISTNGTGRLFVDAGGNVGVGYASPSNFAGGDLGATAPLVVGDGTGSRNVNIFSADNNYGHLAFGDGTSGSSIYAGLIQYYHASDSMAFYTGSSMRMLIDSSGRVGLGTSSPASLLTSYPGNVSTLGAKASTGILVDNNGTAGNVSQIGLGYTFSSTYHPVAIAAITDSGSGSTRADLHFATRSLTTDSAPDTRMIIKSDGKVGIGTTSPDERLTLGAASKIKLNRADNATGATIHNGGGLEGLIFNELNAEGCKFQNNGTTVLRIDSLNRVGIGTTSVSNLLHLRSDSASNVDHLYLQNRNGGANSGARIAFSNGTNDYADNRYAYIGAINTGASESGNHLVFATNANGGSPSEKARIDSSGRLLVGTSSARSNADYQFGLDTPRQQLELANGGLGFSIIQNYDNGTAATPAYLTLARAGSTAIGSTTIVANNNWLGEIDFSGSDGTDFTRAASIRAEVDGTPGANDMPGRLVFSTTADGASSPTERMRISANGQTDVFVSSADGIQCRNAASAGIANYVFAGRHSATDTTSGTVSFLVYTNGNALNTNNSYAGISDIKLKENVVDASSQWNDLKALQVRNYNFKEGQTHTQIGLVAQEVELVSPGLVSESPDRDEEGNDLGTTTKSVNYSVLYMKAVKALQEAMERIEVLEAKVNALEGN
jgi:hypothetical protein